jgi:hypothetical protein
MRAPPLLSRSSNKAAALIIVLAFVVLLTGLSLAYFSHTTSERQLAHSSYNDTSANLLARTAVDKIIGDFRQEIITGSTATTVNGSTIYVPASAANVVPRTSGNPDPAQIRNLIRRSVSPDNISPPGVQSSASAVNSTTYVSANGRFVTPARWNSHYLVPKQSTGTDDSIPITAFANATPDWVFVTDQGPTVITSQNSSVIGRYSYAVYDEGGLLDMNVAGYPTDPSSAPVPAQRVGRKGSIAFADLAALGSSDAFRLSNPDTAGVYQTDRLVGWRNYAISQPSNNFPASNFAANFQSSTQPAINFYNFVTSPTNPFLTVRSDVNTPPVGVPVTFNGRTDQMFLGRQELIAFRKAVGSITSFSANVLQHLGTFSREQNIPTWLPSPLLPTSLLARFPIGQLVLVSTTPPISGNSANIKKYFGLQWDSTNSRWQYVEGGTLLLSTISPVGAVQANLFQVLNYVLPGHTTSEILQLGACIIDQYDMDTVTTQIEYAPAGSIAYGREAITPPNPPTAPPPPAGYFVINRAFQNAGELGYALNPITGSKLNFHASPSGNADARLLDFFTINTATPRAGIVNLNTRNPSVLAAMLNRAIITESTSSIVNNTTDTTTAANSIVTETTNTPALGRADVARLASVVINTPFTTNDETRETIARALAEVGQVRTWGLLVDVIAQTGRYPPNATSFENGFVVEGEQHYWVHVAIDRFTGQVIDRQFEEVKE